ncbi:hypothetical protein MMC27_002309 [Xylographa pallens]|nr:hypothetical protein [Xylographa pallens]
MVKFHYVNVSVALGSQTVCLEQSLPVAFQRKSEGLKLGKVVGKDLLKRIPPGPNYKAAIRDPSVDIDVSGKALSDEGLEEVAKALVKSMTYDGEHGKVVRLEEVCLKENKLTAECLRSLAGVIALAASDLRDLDLSDNSICIITDKQAADWEEFLESFSRCCALRRIDLSGNALGRRAFETLARVYGKSEPIDELFTFDATRLHPDLQTSSASYESDDGSLAQKIRKASIVSDMSGYMDDCSIIPKLAQHGHDGSSEELESIVQSSPRRLSTITIPSHLYPKTRGLRSIPYLVLANTVMDDNCALHLSYIVENHNSPHHLLHYVPTAKAGLPAQQLEAYDRIQGCNGIIYRPNTALGSAGNKVLELAELARKGVSQEARIQTNSQEADVSGSPILTSRRGSDARLNHSPMALVSRRRSIVSIDTSEQSNHITSRAGELHRARSRIEGDVLRDVGPQSNDLWRSSLKMLSVSRTLLLQPKKPPREVTSTGKIRKAERKPLLSNPSHAMKTAFPILPSSTPLAPGNPNQPIIFKLPHRRKDSFDPLDLKMTRAVSRTATLVTEPPAMFQRPKNDNEYRSPLPGGLDERLWARIISLACGCTGILNAEQALAVVKWARDRASLQREMEALGKAESAQVWRVLEGIGCLAYEIGA